jgi:putative MATE family efflux protein
MVAALVSVVVNVALDYILIFGKFGFPAMGVRGAAIATVIGAAVACIMSIQSICKKDSYMNLSYILREKIKPSIQPAFSMFKIGSTVFVEQILVRVGFMSVAVMAAKLGTDTFAAHQVGMSVMGLSFSFGDGMQVAAVALIGQSLGENKPELAKLYGKICRQIGMLIAVVLSVIYLIFGEWLFRQFFSEESIVATGMLIMKVIVLVVLLQIGQVIYMGCLRGAGDVVFTTAASTISVTIVRPLASYLLCYVFGFGIVGIWLGIVADQITRFALTAWRFRSGVWLNIKI